VLICQFFSWCSFDSFRIVASNFFMLLFHSSRATTFTLIVLLLLLFYSCCYFYYIHVVVIPTLFVLQPCPSMFQVPIRPSRCCFFYIVVLLFPLSVWYFPSPLCHVQVKTQSSNMKGVFFPIFWFLSFFTHFVIFFVNVLTFKFIFLVVYFCMIF
jgi:hypothetical protein